MMDGCLLFVAAGVCALQPPEKKDGDDPKQGQAGQMAQGDFGLLEKKVLINCLRGDWVVGLGRAREVTRSKIMRKRHPAEGFAPGDGATPHALASRWPALRKTRIPG